MACPCGTDTRGTCAKCGCPRCDKHRYHYVDESNRSITANSPALCLACYRAAYPWAA